MFVVPKETYFRLMQNVSEVQKQEIDAINVDQVNVSCGPLLVGLKKNAKETALKKKRKIEPANSATSLTKPSSAKPHGITVSPFLTPPTPSSSIAVKNLTPPTPTPATATTTTTTTTPPPPPTTSAVANTSSNVVPKITVTNESNKPMSSQSSIVNMLLNKDNIAKPYGDQERMFNQDSVQKTASLNGKSALDVVNTAIMKNLNNSENTQEKAEVMNSVKNTKKPSAVHSLVEDFNKITSPRKPNDLNAVNEKATDKEKSEEQRSPSKQRSSPKQKRSPPKTSPKYTKPRPASHRTSLPGTRTVVQEKGKINRAKRRADGEVIVTPEKKMKPINYKH